MDTGNSSTPAADAQTQRGRKLKLPITDKIAALRAELAQAEAAQREAQKAQATIVGTVVIEAMTEDADLSRRIVALLRSKVMTARDKAAIAGLLI